MDGGGGSAESFLCLTQLSQSFVVLESGVWQIKRSNLFNMIPFNQKGNTEFYISSLGKDIVYTGNISRYSVMENLKLICLKKVFKKKYKLGLLAQPKGGGLRRASECPHPLTGF